MMKNLFYFSLIISVSYILSSARGFVTKNSQEFDCSSAQPPAINCAVYPNCLYPNPRNCSQYYHCNDALQAYTMECPLYQAPNKLLVFNNNTKHCDYPENYNCLATPTPSMPPPENEQPMETTTTSTGFPSETPNTESSSPSDETPQPTTDIQSETTTTDDQTTTPDVTTSKVPEQQTTTELTTPPAENDPPVSDGVCYTALAQQELSVNCYTARQCKFADPITCQGYVQCVASIDTPPYNPIAYRMWCPLGNDGQLLYWNDNSYTCERREDSTCAQFSSRRRF